ncbi:hypothetical protein Lalb_Chr22g0351951 [Lupinus albus]|uniref:Uncharacterized protein n=1 Tax=Lupinus albus TaxID=3870 RepID=A0A6A4NKP9_LUPAL|nr:hypothetical protein Lalb_Chr22g0351951 [Lupinus albus]
MLTNLLAGTISVSMTLPRSLSRFSSGKMTEPRSGLSLFLISQHFKANLANDKVSSTGQSVTFGSSTSSNLPGQCRKMCLL